MDAPHDDDEAEAEAVDPEPESESEATLRRRRDRDDEGDEESARKRLRIVIPLVMAAAGIACTMLIFVKSQGTYSKAVDELAAQQAGFVNKPVRVDGMLVHGSLALGENGCDHRFTIAKNDVEMRVRFPECVVPDNLRDVPGIDVEVEVEGRLEPDGSLAATRVFTKCPSRYAEKQLAAQGVKRPH